MFTRSSPRGFAPFLLALATLAGVAHCSKSQYRPPVNEGLPTSDGGTGGTTNGSSQPGTTAGTTTSGNGSAPQLAASLATLDFGQVGCGKTARIDFTLENKGGLSLAWNGEIRNASNNIYVVEPSSGTLDAGKSMMVSVKVVSSGVPKAAVTTDYGAVLAIRGTSYAAATLDIPVKLAAKGASLRFTTPNPLDFGAVPLNAQPSQTISIFNEGNTSAVVSLGATPVSSPFTRTPSGTLTVPAGQTVTVTTTFKPTSTTPASVGLQLVNADPAANIFCSDPELPTASFVVKGEGSNGVALLEPADVYFGAETSPEYVDCGTQGASRPLTISNTGNASFTWDSSFASGGEIGYTVTPTSGTVAPGSFQTVTITPPKLTVGTSTLSTAKEAYAAQLTIVTKTALGETPHAIKLHQTARGAVVTSTFAGTSHAFGTVPVGATSTTTFSLLNVGNVDATLDIKPGNLANFPVTPNQVVVPQNSAAVPVSLTFSPQSVQTMSDVAAMKASASTPLCAPLPSNIVLSGTGVAGFSMSVSRSEITFGKIKCGQSGGSQTFTLTNNGTSSFNWSGALRNGLSSLFALSKTSGTLAAGASENVQVTMGTLPIPSSVADDFYADLLTITAQGTVAGFGTASMPIRVTAEGAVLAFAPTEVDFGTVPVNSNGTTAVSLVNKGNAAVEVNITSSDAHFTRSPLGALTVPAGGSLALTGGFTPTTTTALDATWTVALSAGNTGSLCSALPSPLVLHGRGGAGVANVSPTTLSFGNNGLVACGTTAAAKTVTLTNTGTDAFTWTAEFASGGSFYTVSPTSGVVPANGGTQNVQITPKAIPAKSPVTTDLYAGALKITTSVPGDTEHVVLLHQTAQGAILRSTAPTGGIDFGAIAIGRQAYNQFSLTNVGNATATVTATTGDTNIFPIGWAMQTLGESQSVALPVSFKPSAAGPVADTVTLGVTAGTVLCDDLPANVPLAGAGTTGIEVWPTNLNFGYVNCDSAGTAQTITVTNTGPQDIKITAVFDRGQGTQYTITDLASGLVLTPGVEDPLAIPGGSSTQNKRSFLITPKKISPPASTSADAFADTLVLTTDTTQSIEYRVALHQTAQGAFLELAPASVSVSRFLTDFGAGAIEFTPMTVKNSGNYPAGYTLGVSVVAGTSGSLLCQASNASFCATYESSNLYPGETRSGHVGFRNVEGAPGQREGYLTLTAQDIPDDDRPLVMCSSPIAPVPLVGNVLPPP